MQVYIMNSSKYPTVSNTYLVCSMCKELCVWSCCLCLWPKNICLHTYSKVSWKECILIAHPLHVLPEMFARFTESTESAVSLVSIQFNSMHYSHRVGMITVTIVSSWVHYNYFLLFLSSSCDTISDSPLKAATTMNTCVNANNGKNDIIVNV